MSLSTTQIVDALRKRYSGRGWAFLPQVRATLGNHACRTADAIAMSLYESRGLELHGFEIKASRNDWLRELKDPAKAEGVSQFCHRWWLVVGDATIVRVDELPATWGLLVPRGLGLVVKVHPSKLSPEPLDYHFLSAILRRFSEERPAPERKIADYKRGVAEGLSQGKAKLAAEADRHQQLQRAFEAFEEVSGVKIETWRAERQGKALKLLLDVPRLRRLRSDTEHAARIIQAAAESVTSAVESLAAITNGSVP